MTSHQVHSPSGPEAGTATGSSATELDAAHRRPAAIFWDMDGTLTDSEPLWAEATFYLSELLGKRLTPTQRLATVGSTFPATLQICAENAGVSLEPGDEQRYRDLMFDKVKSLFGQRLEVFPGIRELLSDLLADGVPMMVTTNTERNVADAAIAAIGKHFFVDTICGDEVPQGKPAPDMYAEAARRLGLEPADCLVFEDSTTGMSAAVAAGCQVIGLPETPEIVVPEGAVEVAVLRESRHLNGAQAADVYRWFSQLTRG